MRRFSRQQQHQHDDGDQPLKPPAMSQSHELPRLRAGHAVESNSFRIDPSSSFKIIRKVAQSLRLRSVVGSAPYTNRTENKAAPVAPLKRVQPSGLAFKLASFFLSRRNARRHLAYVEDE